MSQKAARAAMPLVTAWIDELRAVFGREEIDAQIIAATRDGLPTFHAQENGHSVGAPLPVGGRAVSAADMVILRPDPKAKP